MKNIIFIIIVCMSFQVSAYEGKTMVTAKSNKVVSYKVSKRHFEAKKTGKVVSVIDQIKANRLEHSVNKDIKNEKDGTRNIKIGVEQNSRKMDISNPLSLLFSGSKVKAVDHVDRELLKKEVVGFEKDIADILIHSGYVISGRYRSRNGVSSTIQDWLAKYDAVVITTAEKTVISLQR